jgi:hypothetical protein
MRAAPRDVAEMILAAGIPNDEARELVTSMGLPDTEMNIQTELLAAVANEGLKGNVRAAESIFGLCREQDGGGRNYYGLPASLLGRAYVDVYRDIRERRHRFYDFKGGRGSLKSSFCAEVVIDEMEKNPQFCAMAVRQVKETLKDSVYAQLVWAIEEMGLEGEYKCTVSPMEIRRTGTGQKIYFRGADDPMKIKSLRPPKGKHIGVVWVEEADQLRGPRR